MDIKSSVSFLYFRSNAAAGMILPSRSAPVDR